MKQRIAIWAAVSTPEQATVDKDSLPGQDRDGRAWAEKNDYDVVATYEVPGHSRQYIHFHEAAEDIPAYAQLEQDCTDKAFDVLWCRERSRLGRTRALIHTVEAVVAESGAEVFSAKTPHEIGKSSKSHRSLISSFEAWQAEDEIDQLRKRHRSGMRARALQGLPSNNWAYGYRPVRDSKGRIIGGEFMPGEIEAVEIVTQLYLNGESLRVIADTLNDSSYPPRKLGQWSHRSIGRMMRNDFYAGFVTHGDVRNREPSDKYPALWDADTHARIILERERRKPGGSRYKSILSGCVLCHKCGSNMILGRPYLTAAYRFRCGKHAKKSLTGEACHANYVLEDDVIEAVELMLDRVRKMSQAELVEMLSGSDDSERSKLEKERERVKQAIDKDQAALDRLVQFVSAGALDVDACASENERITKRSKLAKKQLSEIDAALMRAPSIDEWLGFLAQVVAMPTDLTSINPDEGRPLLQRAGVRVWCEAGQVVRVEVG
jgi:DNA invertase Pin-like site-specific DNA recombinase